MSELVHDIVFGEGGNSHRYVLEGWGTPEGVGGHTWTVGVVSQLRFDLPETDAAYVLVMRAKPWLHPPHIECQRVMLGMENRVLAQVDFVEDSVVALDLPPGGDARILMIGHVDSKRSAEFSVYRDGRSMGLMMNWIGLFRRTPRHELAVRTGAPIPGRLDDGTLTRAAEQATGRSMAHIMGSFESLGEWCHFAWMQQRFGADHPTLLRFAGLHTPDLLHGLLRRFDGIARLDRMGVFHAPATPELFDVHDRTYRVWWHTGRSVHETDGESVLQGEVVRMPYLQRKFAKGLAGRRRIYVMTVPVSDSEALAIFMALDLWARNTLLYVTQDGPHKPGTVERLCDGMLRGTIDRTDVPRRGTEEVWVSVLANAYMLAEGLLF